MSLILQLKARNIKKIIQSYKIYQNINIKALGLIFQNISAKFSKVI